MPCKSNLQTLATHCQKFRLIIEVRLLFINPVVHANMCCHGCAATGLWRSLSSHVHQVLLLVLDRAMRETQPLTGEDHLLRQAGGFVGPAEVDPRQVSRRLPALPARARPWHGRAIRPWEPTNPSGTLALHGHRRRHGFRAGVPGSTAWAKPESRD